MRREQNNKLWLPAMPPVLVGRYLIDFLFEIGPATSTGMGYAAIKPPHIEAWMRMTGFKLQPWEVRYLLRLSREYVNQSNDPEEPWDTAERKRRTAMQTRALKDSP